LNSTFANNATQRAHAGDPTIELAAEDARQRNLVEGQWAVVYNDRGRFLARVATTGSVRPGVAVATGIYWSKLSPGGANVNHTTPSALTDMGGGATFFDNLVQVRASHDEEFDHDSPVLHTAAANS
jgi:anaerobic selenocysteine-containing dehydrogenase